MTKDFWEYDPATNTWTQKADFGGTGRTYAVGFAINSNGYIGMGAALDNNYQVIDFQDFWAYDPTADTWTQKSDFGGKQTAAVGFAIGSKGYIGTGIDDPNINSTIKDFWEYDPNTDAWTQKAAFGGTARTLATGFSIGNKGYIGTGIPDFNSISITKDFWEYTPNVVSIISLNPIADKTSLWPPDNQMVDVTIQVNANDSAGRPVTLYAQVSCNEPAKRGQDWTQPVIDQETGVISLSLRASRSGNGTGRIYTIIVTATGTEGNSETETVSIVVPHDQGK